ncbi:MAG: gluconokinase [Actinomycetota bacterium]|nr:gluconokinase [Actinomycetota bacterium]
MTEPVQPAAASTSSPPVVLVLMGVSGSGKTTIANALIERLGWEFEEGDNLHPKANRDKMAAGIPLTDDDRWPWLQKISDWVRQTLSDGHSGIITCSALRQAYRDKLRGDGVLFVFLHGSRELIAGRLSHRQGHFMPASLLGSQFGTLEIPTDESDVLTIELGGTPEQETDRTLDALRRKGIEAPTTGPLPDDRAASGPA